MNKLWLASALLSWLFCLGAASAIEREAHLMRYADVHEGVIVFTYEDDLWRLEEGETIPRRLTRDAGTEAWAKFSPDGARIAFTAQYDGGVDVYVMNARGGVPRRLTWHPAPDRVLGWTPDGTKILFRSRRDYPTRGEEVYLVSVGGGLPERLPVDRAGLASLSPDGTRLAYNRISREERTWKRHQGGTAQDVWVGTLGRADFERVTTWEGTDNYPMWIGGKIYFTSDRSQGTLNIYSYDVSKKQVEAVTAFGDYDVKYPSGGPGEIVFQYGESLHLLDLASGEVTRVPVHLHSDRVPVREEYVKAGQSVDSFRLSPDGSQLLLADRGELVSIPVGEGEPVHLTSSSGSRQKDAVFAPDGSSIAYISDETGEEEIWLMPVGDRPTERRTSRPLTSGSAGFRLQPVWSPQSDRLLFSDKFMRLQLVDLASGEVRQIDEGEYDEGWYRWGIQDYRFSPDGRFVVYTKMERSLNESLFVYEIDTGSRHRVTGPETSDWSPSFDPNGRYLYFLSSRTFDPVMGKIDQNHVFLDTVSAYLVLLDGDAFSPFGPASLAEEDPEAEGDQDAPPASFEIDLEGLSERVLAVEGLPAADYERLEATDDGFLLLKRSGPQFLKYQQVSDETNGKLTLVQYDLAEGAARELLEGIGNYHLSADGKKLVYRAGDVFGVVNAGAEGKVGDGEVDLSQVRHRIDRLAEFEQIFDEAWRVQRDWFYDPEMHGVDWEAIGAKYRRFVPDCSDRSDLNYLIGEMIGELAAGHTYVFGGDVDEGAKRYEVGLLGADLEMLEGATYPRIARLFPGVSWDPGQRSPLAEPGCGIEEGDYLIAIDGHDLGDGTNPLRHLERKVGRRVELSYHDAPTPEGARTCMIEPIGRESGIRYRAWVERNRRMVEKLGGGKLGYLHIPDMMQRGLIEFARAFYPNYHKQGLVIDVRYNGGGFVGDMIIDRLERELWALTKPREGRPIPDPERGFHGHLVVLINADTGSNGEYFAEAIKIKGLAPIVGERTWGGAIGIEPHQDLVDDGLTTPPQFAPYGLDGGWLIEGRGVEPDVPVPFPPAAALSGKDPQIERAVEMLLDAIAKDPRTYPDPPPYPVKTK